MICSTEPPPVHCLKMQLKSESQSKSIEREQTHTKSGPGLPNRLLELGLFSQFYRSEVADLSVNGHCDLDVQSVIPNLSLSAKASYQHQFSSYYRHKLSCLVMRTMQMIIQSNLSEMENKILPTCLQRKYRDSLGEFSNTSYGVFGVERARRRLRETLQGGALEQIF